MLERGSVYAINYYLSMSLKQMLQKSNITQWKGSEF